MRSSHGLGTLVATLVTLVPCGLLAIGPGYLPASRSVTYSNNKRFCAEVIPAERSKDGPSVPARLRVFEGKPEDGSLVWKVDITNRTAPDDVFISNDGEYVVTFGNWTDPFAQLFGIACEDHLAFYDRGGRSKAYSNVVFDLLPTGAAPPSLPSLGFLIEGKGQPFFCQWLGRECYLAWSVMSGEQVSVSDAMLAQCNQRARNRALGWIEDGGGMWLISSGGDQTLLYIGAKIDTALNYLATTKHPENRKVVEKLLTDDGFFTSKEFSAERPYFMASSPMRILADVHLAHWGAAAPLGSVDTNSEAAREYQHLGKIHGTVRLPLQPKEWDGQVWIYLVPENVKPNDWIASEPVQRVRINLDPEHGEVGKAIDFRLYGVTPGRYWVKAVWDRKFPFVGLSEMYTLCPGDYESTEMVDITVMAKETVEGVTIDCLKPTR